MTKAEKPPTLDLDFNDALGRLAVNAPKEPGASNTDLVPLVEDDNGHRFLVYATQNGPRAELRYEGNTFWASQGQMAEMFGVTPQNVTTHLKNIFMQG